MSAMWKLKIIAAAGMAILPRAGFADPVPKTAPGLELVQKNCAQCHMVSPSSKRGWTDAPAFEVIANRPGSTAAALSAKIQKPHMKMLNTGRPPEEADDIAAYIMTLRRG